jgi:Tol biopolymer transport system component
MGVPFDPRQRRIMGETRPITDATFTTGPSRFDMSRSGLLAFNAQSQVSRELAMVDRAGRARIVADRNAYLFPRFSPSGTRVVVGILGSLANTREGDLWSIDVATGVRLRVTTDGMSTRPAWTPDGRSLIYSRRAEAGRQSLARVNADGTTPSATLLQRPASIFEAGLTADGRTLVWREDNLATGRDIFAMPVDSPAAAWPVLQTRFNERGISVGPEGDWLAYASNESGRDEVYIRRLAPESPRWPVSRNGGVEPRWTRSGELFFRKADSVLVSRITIGTEPRIAEPSLLFTGQYQLLGLESTWDAAPDGKSFIMVSAPEGQSTVMLYANWLDRWKAANAQAR